MNDDTTNKVNLFSSGQGDGKTMHNHNEPPALSFQPGATFAPGASVSTTQDNSAITTPHEPESKITAKLDDIIAKSDDAPIRSTAKTGNVILDEIKVSELNRNAINQPVMDIIKKSPDINTDKQDRPSPINSINDIKKDGSEEDSLHQNKTDADLKDQLEQSYSLDHNKAKQDMPVKPEATDKPLIHDDEVKSEKLDQNERDIKSVKLNNVKITDQASQSKPNSDNKTMEVNHRFPNENHLAGEHIVGSSATQKNQLLQPSEKSKPAGKRSLKYATVAVVATLIVGVGGAMAYSPARKQITAILTGKKTTPVSTITPQPSTTTQAEQDNSSEYSTNDYLQGLSSQNDNSDNNDSNDGVFNFNNKANYAQDSGKATISMKLTTGNIPTIVAPPVVGSIFPSIPATQVVSDYIGLDSPCFLTILPKDNQPFYNDWCVFGAKYGAQMTSDLQILPYAKSDKANFDNVISYFKSNQDPNIKLSSETTILVGGVSARKLVFNGSSGAQSFPDIMVIVDFGKDRYTKDKSTAYGFIIAGSYKDDYSKKNFDTALAHWNWK